MADTTPATDLEITRAIRTLNNEADALELLQLYGERREADGKSFAYVDCANRLPSR